MSDREPSQSFREFMFQEVCEHLTPKEVKSLAYSQNLPAPYLSKDATEVLMKLETQEKLSENNLEPLAKMMRDINRKDIAKKVEKYLKKKHKHHSKKGDQANNVNSSMLQDCRMLALLQTTQLCTKILLEQAEELRSTAGERSYIGIEREMAEALSILEIGFQQKLRMAASYLHLRQDSMESQGSSPPCSLSSSEDCRSPGNTLERGGHRPRADAMSKSASLPKDFSTSPKLPILPPARPTEQEEEHTYEYVEHSPHKATQVPLSLYYSSSAIKPQNIQDDSRGQMVTGRDGAAKTKPAVAPKPKKNSAPTVPAGGESDYTGGSGSTGDSGFADAQQFLKESVPRPKPRHKYTPLNAEQREEPPSYALPSAGTDKDVVYDQVCHEAIYVNVDRP